MKSIDDALKFTGISKISAFNILNKIQKGELKVENVVGEFLNRIKTYNKVFKVFKYLDEKIIFKQIEDQKKLKFIQNIYLVFQ